MKKRIILTPLRWKAEKDSVGFVDIEENKAGVKRELLDTVKKGS